MIKFKEILREIKIIPHTNKKYIFAMCDYTGQYQELLVLKHSEIIRMGEEDEDEGYYHLIFIEEGQEQEGVYLDYVEI